MFRWGEELHEKTKPMRRQVHKCVWRKEDLIRVSNSRVIDKVMVDTS